ncbi:MAG TPA: B12-binding domain-containing radical SAM protein [Chitinophagaceae bacterium]|nr:B12-binding domain-containing radical SAM protein [Chitinophagaceae bacterium]
MQAPVYLITPPFTQLNTPYPATAYLKGFLNMRKIQAYQSDLGIEVTLQLFSQAGLKALFAHMETVQPELSENGARIRALKDDYIQTIDEVILFLQGRRPTLAHRIARRDFLPEAGRFAQLDDLQWAFGSMGVQDRAKHLATMYLEDLSDLVKEAVDEHFGFSRYAERLGRSAQSFDVLYHSLQQPYTYIDRILTGLLAQKMAAVQPKLVALSVPFPGNLYTSLRCGQWIKQHCPGVKVAMGGGFANTELRSLSDPRVFEFYDFITLDDGEAPIELLLEHVEGKRPVHELKRTFTLLNGAVTYINNTACSDYRQGQVGTPDYSDFYLDRYISAIEVVNPMHSLWSDGRWNKLTMAHGCYWGKCTFCDTSLDYIRLYEPVAASLLVDRMEELIAQTGQNGFHFVDEAAPPALMKALAIEIIRRRLVVSWWANVRFEKSFTRDLCLLLKASGCIAISGGLEVASDRLLQLINKGITVAQVARVNRNFTEAGIMVHAYLMYGFPTQTEQETIDSLEMVRQLFEAGILQSAYWHLFTMTAHSPVGLQPERYSVRRLTQTAGTFANNDLEHDDPTGAEHERFGYGLTKALLNFMHGACLDYPLHKWFDFKVPKTSVPPDFIRRAVDEPEYAAVKASSKVVYLGQPPRSETVVKSKKGAQWEVLTLTFYTRKGNLSVQLDPAKGAWLLQLLPRVHVSQPAPLTLQLVQADYEAAGFDDFALFWENKPVNTLFRAGLLQV